MRMERDPNQISMVLQVYKCLLDIDNESKMAVIRTGIEVGTETVAIEIEIARELEVVTRPGDIH